MIDSVAEDDTLPRESVTVAVKVIVPEEFKNPVVKLDAVSYTHLDVYKRQL